MKIVKLCFKITEFINSFITKNNEYKTLIFIVESSRGENEYIYIYIYSFSQYSFRL